VKTTCGFIRAASHKRSAARLIQKRVERADHSLHETIEHRGYQSEEAEHARHDFRKRVNNVGTEIIGGGTQTKNAGIQIGMGMTTTTQVVKPESKKSSWIREDSRAIIAVWQSIVSSAR